MNSLQIVKDAGGKKITVTGSFDATPEQVWSAWTESELLDQWWAPEPYHAQTKTINFTNGGYWLYAMVGPEGDKNWCRADFSNIQPYTSFEAVSLFCDENGTPNNAIPPMRWKSTFQATATGTTVIAEIAFDTTEGLNTILEMGFREGFTAALGNLERYFSKQAH